MGGLELRHTHAYPFLAPQERERRGQRAWLRQRLVCEALSWTPLLCGVHAVAGTASIIPFPQKGYVGAECTVTTGRLTVVVI